MNNQLMPEKKALREHFSRLRAGLAAGERAEKAACIADRIADLPEYRNASVLLIYAALPGEVDLQPLADHPASAGKRLAYPVCVSRTDMKAMIPGGWRCGAYGIREPDPACSEDVPPEDLDLVICPGLAFDETGTRLGMGGGYYDRFLPRCARARVIMAAFEAQHAAILPREGTDVRMDRIVTEDAVY